MGKKFPKCLRHALSFERQKKYNISVGIETPLSPSHNHKKKF